MLSDTLERLRRLALLDLAVLDEVRVDARATLSALVVAVGSIALLGLGGWLWWVSSGLGDRSAVFVKTVVLGTASATVAWLVWLLIAYAILNRIGRVAVDVGGLVRTASFACTPLAAALLMIVRPLAFGVGVAVLAAWVAATQIAITRATRRTDAEVLLANAAGFGAWALLMSLVTSGAHQVGPGPFLAESIWEAVTSGNIFFGS